LRGYQGGLRNCYDYVATDTDNYIVMALFSPKKQVLSP
jgi:hypothetical protein